MAGAAKDAAEHLASLKDGRAVWLDGARVENPTEHPAFRNAVRSAAGLYGYQADPANLEAMTFASPTGRRRVNRAWQMPTSLEELVQRRRALTAWAECHAGFMGRAPRPSGVRRHRADHGAGGVRSLRSGPRPRVPRLFRACARQRPLPHLCDRQSAIGPLEEHGRTRARQPHAPHRGRGRGRGHGARRQDARHRGDPGQ